MRKITVLDFVNQIGIQSIDEASLLLWKWTEKVIGRLQLYEIPKTAMGVLEAKIDHAYLCDPTRSRFRSS